MTQLRSVEVGRSAVVQSTGIRDSSMLTQDENIVDIRFTVQYRLKDARDYVFENRNPDDAVVQAAESAVREIVGKSVMDSVLYEQRDAIAADLVKSIQEQLDRLKAGILVANVNVQSVQAPEQVQAAFDDAFKAGADRERLKNEGQAYANDVIPKAQGTAARLREEAEAYKARVVAQAEGDANRFSSVLTEYQKAPAVTRDRMYLDTMQQIYSNVSKVLVDSRNNSNLLYLPLDKLLSSSGQPASDAAAPAPVEPARAACPLPRSTCARATASAVATVTVAESRSLLSHESHRPDRYRRVDRADVGILDPVHRRPAAVRRDLRARRDQEGGDRTRLEFQAAAAVPERRLPRSARPDPGQPGDASDLHGREEGAGDRLADQVADRRSAPVHPQQRRRHPQPRESR